MRPNEGEGFLEAASLETVGPETLAKLVRSDEREVGSLEMGLETAGPETMGLEMVRSDEGEGEAGVGCA